MAEVTVAILGLERLGASFGLAFKRYMEQKDARHSFFIIGTDRRGFNGKHAKRIGAVDKVTANPLDAVAKAQIVLMTEHYNRVQELYEAVGPKLKPGTVVLDASPLIGPSIRWAAAALPADPEVAAYMVGIAPVLNPAVLYQADNEVEAARADLFDKGTIILAPAPDCPAEAVELAAEVTRIVGAKTHFMDPAEYDGLAAAMEGLPAALALGLFRMLTHSRGWGDMQRLANPAFGLMTSQLRYQHPDSLWALLHYNRENTVRHLDALIETLIAMRDSLYDDEAGLAIEAVAAEAGAQYEEWERRRMANRWDEPTDDAGAIDENVLTSMGGLLFGRRGYKKKDG